MYARRLGHPTVTGVTLVACGRSSFGSTGRSCCSLCWSPSSSGQTGSSNDERRQPVNVTTHRLCQRWPETTCWDLMRISRDPDSQGARLREHHLTTLTATGITEAQAAAEKWLDDRQHVRGEKWVKRHGWTGHFSLRGRVSGAWFVKYDPVMGLSRRVFD